MSLDHGGGKVSGPYADKIHIYYFSRSNSRNGLRGATSGAWERVGPWPW